MIFLSLRDANTGDGQEFTGLAAAVQLRLRVAVSGTVSFGGAIPPRFCPVVQSAERRSLKPDVGGANPSGAATLHGDQDSRVANFDSEVPALNRREHGANPWRPTILMRSAECGMRNEPSIAFSTPQSGFRNRVAPVAQVSERRASNAEVAGETRAGSAS